jgi:predicted DNA-binding protein (MmcQ/YjbR family)
VITKIIINKNLTSKSNKISFFSKKKYTKIQVGDKLYTESDEIDNQIGLNLKEIFGNNKIVSEKLN